MYIESLKQLKMKVKRLTSLQRCARLFHHFGFNIICIHFSCLSRYACKHLDARVNTSVRNDIRNIFHGYDVQIKKGVTRSLFGIMRLAHIFLPPVYGHGNVFTSRPNLCQGQSTCNL